MAVPPATTSLSAGSEWACSWTLYFHDPADTLWTPESYKRIGTFRSFESLWGTFHRISNEQFLGGMYFLMKDPYLPLWEHRSNIHGGSYSIKVPESQAYETYQRYCAAGILELIATDAKNSTVGITISPKKGFHILKLWNTSSKLFNKPADVHIYSECVKLSDIMYRPHVDQKM